MKRLRNAFAELLYRLSERLRDRTQRLADRIEDLSDRLFVPDEGEKGLSMRPPE